MKLSRFLRNELLYLHNKQNMKNYIGTITAADLHKADRKASREIELENATGWTAKNKAHKSAKTYTRKAKHKMAYC